MENKSNLTKIIVAVLVFSGIILPVICNHYWNTDKKPVPSKKQEFTIAGNVVDAYSNDEIGQAEITVIGRNEHTTTQTDGNFIITFKDSVSSVKVRITKKGYMPIDQGFDVPYEPVTIQLTKDKNK